MNKLIEVARQMLGKTEGRDRAALMDYLKTGGANLDPATTAWCAAYVNSTLEQAGYSGTGSNMARSFLEWGNAVEGDPQPGDVGVWPRGSDQTKGHVGFVESYDPKTGTVQLLAGNQGDAVSSKPWSFANALGFRRPDEQQPGSYTEDPRADTPSSGRPIGSQLPGQPTVGPGGDPGNEFGQAVKKGVTAPKPEKSGWEAFGDKFSEGAGDMALGTAAPQQPQGQTPPGAVLAPTAGVTYDVESIERRRKELAEKMAKLNSGKLFL